MDASIASRGARRVYPFLSIFWRVISFQILLSRPIFQWRTLSLRIHPAGLRSHIGCVFLCDEGRDYRAGAVAAVVVMAFRSWFCPHVTTTGYYSITVEEAISLRRFVVTYCSMFSFLRGRYLLEQSRKAVVHSGIQWRSAALNGDNEHVLEWAILSDVAPRSPLCATVRRLEHRRLCRRDWKSKAIIIWELPPPLLARVSASPSNLRSESTHEFGFDAIRWYCG